MMVKHGKAKIAKRELPLQITSMMDMFTLILLFLLKSYSAEGSILTNADNLVLPNSSSHKKPISVNLQLAVTNDMVLVDNIPLLPTDAIRSIPADDPDPLVRRLPGRGLLRHPADERRHPLD